MCFTITLERKEIVGYEQTVCVDLTSWKQAGLSAQRLYGVDFSLAASFFAPGVGTSV